MYTTPGGLHSYSPSLFQEHYQGFLGAAHAIDGSSSGSITVPAREEIQTHSQGHYGETPENSPRGGYHQDSLPQYEPPTPRSPGSIGSEGPASVVMTAPVDGCYMQVPVLFMMIPMVPGYQQDSGWQTKTSPSSSASSGHENYDSEYEQIQTQTAHDSLLAPTPAGFTTLVVRNIPARYKPSMLLQEFGSDGSFDFLFLPYSFRESSTMGVAFINFRSHDCALSFQERWQRQFLRDHGRTKHLDVAAATYQGLVQNLKQFNPKNIARLDCAGMLPIFFDSLGNRLNSMQELKRYGVLPAAF
eukprot:TRINITY_DN2704_c0_g2_i5.p1 TRINITY_DN2704_c0_g2~~TRINITY_DN2704_c0_g2_i5.p1  ORF type:complete len:301 (-),score=43.49 TRINITY_DN2704_c0_g2_i5:223-1125(-)